MSFKDFMNEAITDKTISVQEFLDQLNNIIGVSDNNVSAVLNASGKIEFQYGEGTVTLPEYLDELKNAIKE